MPRPGPRRPLVCFRLSEEEVNTLDGVANKYNVTRSDVIRAVLIAGITVRAARDLAIAELVQLSSGPGSPNEHQTGPVSNVSAGQKEES